MVVMVVMVVVVEEVVVEEVVVPRSIQRPFCAHPCLEQSRVKEILIFFPPSPIE